MGSFLNVLIDRIPANKSVLFGRSHCDFCHHTLSAFDLIPIVSFAFLRGKCRYCHKKLSFQYPLIELLTGIAFIGIFLFQWPTDMVHLGMYSISALLFSLGIALAIMDIKYHILSDALLIVFGILVVCAVFLVDPTTIPLRLVVAIMASLPLFLIFLFSKGRGMGFGDVKLVAILGFLLGFPYIVVAYYIAFLTGGICGVILILEGKKKFKGSTIAFGPFLFLGALLALIWGDFLWKYAVRILGF